MSKVSETELTDEHIRILDYVQRYYERHKVGPLFQNLKKHMGVTREDIDHLFPYGLNSVYTWVGIPIHSADQVCKPLATIQVKDFRQVYLDYNGTTPLRKEIVESLVEYTNSSEGFGNPSSSTPLGKFAYDTVREARFEIASCLDVKSEDIIFTGCGSEANNLAIKGIAFQHLDRKGHIISSKVEHASVLQTLAFLQQIGFDVTYLDVDSGGVISPQAVQDALKPETILVAIMAVNNEVGSINPVHKIGSICQSAGIPFMVDAIQAFGKIPLCPKEMGISLMSMSGHKLYAPKGVGALYVAESISLTPLIHGGGQEFGLRAGTENVGSIAAFGKAAKLSYLEMTRESERLLTLRNYFLAELREIVPDFIINGSLESRLSNNLNIGFPGIDSGSLLLSLNQIGIYVSAGSACSAGSREVSHVIKALGVDTDHYGVIRFSFGLQTAKDDLDYLFEYLPEILKQL
jgi:cysteine desulfurase